ncbi:MAG: hypothetical protein U0821_19345 [Chloroflexota bacterium]
MTRATGIGSRLLGGRRRKLLAIGGLGAVAALARQPETAHAVHQIEDIGIGVANPTSGAAPTTSTILFTSTSGSGFYVQQADNAVGIAITGYGGSNSASGNGGRGMYAQGGFLIGGSGTGRTGGVGVDGAGGYGFSRGSGGIGGRFSGGSSASTAGPGVVAAGGQNTASALAVGGTGVSGLGGFGGNNVTRTGIGVLGQSTSAEGVRGESTTGPGTLGVSSNGVGLFAVSHTNWGLYSQSPNYAGVFQGSVYIAGGLKLLGGFLTAVKHPDGSTRAAHGVTSAEPLIEDVGRARLANGAAHIDLDPSFAALIQSADYTVFLSPEGDSNGLFVTHKTASGFDVLEQKAGTSTLDFGYRVVARRRDADRTRLARLDHLDPLPDVKHTEMPPSPPEPVTRDASERPSTPSSPSTAPAPRR